MPTTPVPSAPGRTHSCDLAYFKSVGTFVMRLLSQGQGLWSNRFSRPSLLQKHHGQFALVGRVVAAADRGVGAGAPLCIHFKRISARTERNGFAQSPVSRVAVGVASVDGRQARVASCVWNRAID